MLPKKTDGIASPPPNDLVAGVDFHAKPYACGLAPYAKDALKNGISMLITTDSLDFNSSSCP